MIGQEKKTIALNWMEVSRIIRESLCSILGHYLNCNASAEDDNYWAVRFQNYRMPLAELYKLFDAVDADEEMRVESTPIPSDKATSVGSFGKDLANELLLRYLGYGWEYQFCDEQTLWLIGITDKAKIRRDPELEIAGKKLWIEELRSREELMDYLCEHGPNQSNLMSFGREYMEQYQSNLCWLYPIPYGDHLGIYLVLVKEGLLGIPYDDADKVDYELFCLEDVKLFETAQEILQLIWNWDCFDAELRQAMSGMLHYLRKKEALDEKEV